MNRLALSIATCAGIGRVPFAPGTFGSIPGVILALGLHALGNPWIEAAVIVLVGVVGVWAATEAEKAFALTDPGPVVIDEVLGMLVTVAFMPVSGLGMFIGFLVFRVCDVIKPFPARSMEKLPGGWGVMGDDLLAGVWGLAIMHALAWAVPQWVLQ
jgi:phosphatidylglycerophosphatase A